MKETTAKREKNQTFTLSSLLMCIDVKSQVLVKAAANQQSNEHT
jgi:hypothetical protein